MKMMPSPAESFEKASKNADGSKPGSRDSEGRFLSGVGNGGSRGGRPRGARSKFTEQFFVDIRDAWERDGPAVISRAFFLDPVASLKAVAGLMPREAKLEVSNAADRLTDEQMERMIALAEAHASKLMAIEGHASEVLPSAGGDDGRDC